MDDQNPFGVSDASLGDRSRRPADIENVQVTPRTIEMLTKTRPWVLFIAILMIIGAVFMVLAAAFMLIAAAMSGGLPGMEGIMGWVMGGLYLIMAALYILPARWMLAYSSRISQLDSTEQVADLESALEAQKNFWKVVGIMCIVMLVLYVGMFAMLAMGIAFTAAGAMNAR